MSDQQERIEHIKAGGTVETDDQAQAMELCKAVKREVPATMRKIEDDTWQVMQVPKGGFGSKGAS